MLSMRVDYEQRIDMGKRRFPDAKVPKSRLKPLWPIARKFGPAQALQIPSNKPLAAAFGGTPCRIGANHA
jgi:hypothetical protein